MPGFPHKSQLRAHTHACMYTHTHLILLRSNRNGKVRYKGGAKNSLLWEQEQEGGWLSVMENWGQPALFIRLRSRAVFGPHFRALLILSLTELKPQVCWASLFLCLKNGLLLLILYLLQLYTLKFREQYVCVCSGLTTLIPRGASVLLSHVFHHCHGSFKRRWQ